MNKLYIDCDRHAVLLKRSIIDVLSCSFDISDLNLGAKNPYPLIAANLAKAIQVNPESLGILLCKTGTGMAIVANKFKGIYAATCHSVTECEYFRKSNHGNVLCLASEILSVECAMDICRTFISTAFDFANQNRIELIQRIEGGI